MNNQMLPENHSYATYASAKKCLEKNVFPFIDNVQWGIMAQEDGRFSAVVFAVESRNMNELIALCARSNYKFGVVSH